MEPHILRIFIVSFRGILVRDKLILFHGIEIERKSFRVEIVQ